MRVPAVAINGRFLARPVTGVERFAGEMLRALDALAAACDTRFELLRPPGSAPPGLDHIGDRQVGRLSGHAWEQIELPFYARHRTLLNLCNTAPLSAPRQWVVIHDAAVFSAPHGYTFAFRSWYRFLFRRLARSSTRMATVSHFSATELERHLGIPRAQIVVLGNSVEHVGRTVPDAGMCDRLGLGDTPFILSVASRNPNKNTGRLVEAFRRIQRRNLSLVLVGGSNARVFSEAAAVEDARIIHTGYVSDAELAGLMREATLFAFPSIYEGFGIPPLEAMWFGCAVAVADIPALRETCGPAAAYFDPGDVDALSVVLQRLMDSPAERAELAARGLVRARERSWQQLASQLLGCVTGSSA